MTSLILGIISLFFVLMGLIPFLGIMIWIALPLLIIGLALGIAGIAKNKRRGINIAGTVICGICIIMGGIRLAAGWATTKNVVDKAPNSIDKLNDTADKLDNHSDSLKKLNNSLNK